MVDLGKYFWICETGTGQQVAQLHDRYMMMMMMMRKVKCTLVQALRLCTGLTAHRRAEV